MLREDQIHRFSRQILLREVGGRGQEKLLSTPVLVRDSSPELDVAVAYLVAGGTPVVLAEGVTIGGFLHGAPLSALSPDAAAQGEPQLSLGCTPTDAPGVIVSSVAVVWRAANAVGGGRPPDAARPGSSLVLGSLAALVIQRLVLGRAEPQGLIWWDGEQLRPGQISQ